MSSQTYFWADALTFKAYLVFTKSLEEFYPTRQQENPEHIQKVIDHIGRENYGASYNIGLGTVCKDQVLVNDPCVHIPLKYQDDPDIRFYTQANPGYTQGHGLIALAPLSGTNFMKLANRLMMKAAKSSLPVFFRAERKETRLAGN